MLSSAVSLKRGPRGQVFVGGEKKTVSCTHPNLARNFLIRPK